MRAQGTSICTKGPHARALHSTNLIYVAVVARVSPVHMLVRGVCSWVGQAAYPKRQLLHWNACARLNKAVNQ
jgi:hypothetical protein